MRIVKLGLLVASFAGATPALAGNQATYVISGTLSPACSITAPGNQSITPTSTASQPIGSPSYQCNFAGSGATIKFWSANASKLLAINANVAYTFVFDSSPTLTLTNAESTAVAIARTLGAANVPQTGAASINVVAGATVAGTYSDTIFMSINP